LAVDIEGLESANDKNPTVVGPTGPAGSTTSATGATGATATSTPTTGATGSTATTPQGAVGPAGPTLPVRPNPNYDPNSNAGAISAGAITLAMPLEELPTGVTQVIGGVVLTVGSIALIYDQITNPRWETFNPKTTANPWGVAPPPPLFTGTEDPIGSSNPFDGEEGGGYDPCYQMGKRSLY